MKVIIEKIISMKHKNKKNISTIKKKSKTYDSIYKALPFAHIGMIYFPSGSPKYKFVEIMGNDIVAYRIAIGSFDLRTRSVLVKNILVSLKLSSYVLLVLLLVIHIC
jgi:hypothetical protein